MSTEYHIPVLLKESVDGLDINPSGTYVDVTFGGGGHSREILRRLGAEGRLIAFDQDEQAYANRPDDKRLTFVRHNFRYIAQFLRYMGIDKVDGLLGDLGVSSHHFDAAERGFSFRFDAPLDMRMGQGMERTAADIVNNYAEDELKRVFTVYGEIANAGRLAKAIVRERVAKSIDTTTRLREIVEANTSKNEQSKMLPKVFQALRIEVNGEMDALREMLTRSTDIIRPGGRMVIIAYHSLEDRMVKNLIRSGNVDKANAEQDIYGHSQTPFEAVNRKAIVPSDEEIERNSRARSAKLRIAVRTNF
ncbi:MAG: 16S rRNA (cytosine(1402)-N(4))-methyltransferase RsmH [Bacteroidales bacterium]|nr:16S rRNA (cytosine(1402)-N(4))-methyltransferase RsmH [Bacteroidales bacterium]